MKIFYHLDLDGKAAGAIVLMYATRHDKYPLECIEINYGMAFPFDRIHENEQVWIVDYSILPEEMDKLFAITSDIIWIGYYKCFAVNMGMISSDDFASIDVDNYDILVGFCTDGKQWRYSLRSDKVDVSFVAMQFGGGGHRGAAGFASADFIL